MMLEPTKGLETIYTLIGRADPTEADLRAAALQVGYFIETYYPEIAERISAEYQWGNPPHFARCTKTLNLGRKS